jgi:ABC-type uncharacterized transport system permease subunit
MDENPYKSPETNRLPLPFFAVLFGGGAMCAGMAFLYQAHDIDFGQENVVKGVALLICGAALAIGSIFFRRRS